MAGLPIFLAAMGCGGGSEGDGFPDPHALRDGVPARYLEVYLFNDKASFNRYGVHTEEHAASIMNLVHPYFMLTGLDLADNEFEHLFQGGVCTPNACGVVPVTPSSDAFTASMVSHSLGHPLGACHGPPAGRSGDACAPLGPDLTGAVCQSRIMAAAADGAAPYTRFSKSTGADIDFHLSGGAGSCLLVPGY